MAPQTIVPNGARSTSFPEFHCPLGILHSLCEGSFSDFFCTCPTDLPDVPIIRNPVQPLGEKDSACAVGQISGSSSRVPPARGASRSSGNVGRDAMDAKAALDERD